MGACDTKEETLAEHTIHLLSTHLHAAPELLTMCVTAGHRDWLTAVSEGLPEQCDRSDATGRAGADAGDSVLRHAERCKLLFWAWVQPQTSCTLQWL
jgi:hypothetical protein